MTIKIITALPISNFIPTKMLIISFEEFNNNFGIDNKAMSKIKI